MAEKISTLILKVNLDCKRCYKEIKEVLCKLMIQDEEKIDVTSYDKKNNTVTITGPFDPQKLSKKLRCKAGNVIEGIQEKEKRKEKGKETKNVKPKDKPDDKKHKAEERQADKKTKETKETKLADKKPKETKGKEDKPECKRADKKNDEPKDKPANMEKPKENKPVNKQLAEQKSKPIIVNIFPNTLNVNLSL